MSAPVETVPSHATATPELPRAMGLRDLVLFNVVAVLSLRWLATAAAAGPSSIGLWVLAALFFFLVDQVIAWVVQLILGIGG